LIPAGGTGKDGQDPSSNQTSAFTGSHFNSAYFFVPPYCPAQFAATYPPGNIRIAEQFSRNIPEFPA
jgi:hypothetical protein